MRFDVGHGSPSACVAGAGGVPQDAVCGGRGTGMGTLAALEATGVPHHQALNMVLATLGPSDLERLAEDLTMESQDGRPRNWVPTAFKKIAASMIACGAGDRWNALFPLAARLVDTHPKVAMRCMGRVAAELCAAGVAWPGFEEVRQMLDRMNLDPICIILGAPGGRIRQDLAAVLGAMGGFRRDTHPDAARFIEGMRPNGDLTLNALTHPPSGGSKRLDVPAALRIVVGNLTIMHEARVVTLPDGLWMGGQLDLTGSRGFERLPDGIHVHGDIRLDHCPGWDGCLPDDAKVTGMVRFPQIGDDLASMAFKAKQGRFGLKRADYRVTSLSMAAFRRDYPNGIRPEGWRPLSV